MENNLIRFNKEAKITFLDFETFNLCLSFQFNRPWQIGILEVVGNEIVKSHDVIVNWGDCGLSISEGAAKVTGYDHNRVLRDGISPEEAFHLMDSTIKDCDYFIGHNILGFDMHLLYEYYKMFGAKTDIIDKSIDTNCLAKAVAFEIPFQKTDDLLSFQFKMYHKIKKGVKTRLEVLGKGYGIDHDYDNLHDAVCDLMLNKKVWDKLKFQLDI